MFREYPKIEQWAKVREFLLNADRVIVQEKFDGSNFAISRGIDDVVRLQSRTRLLDPLVDGRAGVFKPAIEWVSDLMNRGGLDGLPGGYTLFGEALNNNGKIKYKDQPPFILFDVFEEPNELMGFPKGRFHNASWWGAQLHIPTPPALFSGPAGLLGDLTTFIGEGSYGADEMEGVVVKGYDVEIWYDVGDGETRYITEPMVAGKLVTERFKETKPPKALRPQVDAHVQIAEAVVTQARLDKAMQRAREEGKDVRRAHTLIPYVAKDVFAEDTALVKDLLLKAHQRDVNGKIAQRVVSLHNDLGVVT